MSNLKLSTGKHGRGIKYHEVNQKWEARIMIDGRRVTLGYYDSVEDAEAAYKSAKDSKKASTLNFLRGNNYAD